jgi:glycosyltransferase involved in cell wall biosynthesis
MNFSLVVPLFNEAPNIAPLYEHICRALHDLDYEIIFVDDGSTDETQAELKKIQNERTMIVTTASNRGQSHALYQGFQAAQGEFIVTMDGDMQNDPADIPLLIDTARNGYDAVFGIRVNRQDPVIKLIQARMANALTNLLLREHFHDRGCSLKCFRRQVAANLEYFDGMHRLFPALLRNHRICEVKVSHQKRLHGQSKYSSLPRAFRAAKGLFRAMQEVKKERP